MKYSIKLLAKMYEEYLSERDFNVQAEMSQHIDFASYNEYEYIAMMKGFDKLYHDIDSLDITERFLKGE